MKEKFSISTPIYYVNAKPHIGHAYTTIAADVLARFQKSQGKDVFFLTGTDEHGLKIQRKAEEEGKDPQEFVDGIAEDFKKLWKDLDIKYDNFIKTTNSNHKKAVQRVLQSLYDKGAIYKGEYEGIYCVGCEQFKTENELVDGKCPDHDVKPDEVKEECYLLKMKDIQKDLIGKIKSDEFKITPEQYKNEILSFLEGQELRDVSISRKNVEWGIKLPFDESHTTYVWADAFLNYMTGLGWDGDEKKVPDFWPADIEMIGKDILRVHATIWPAMLLHLGIPLPKKLFTHGHILSGGKKMSKTLGNTIAIEEMIKKFGVDGTRYLLLSAGTFGYDIDVTIERMVEKYNADLANGLGNLVSRVVKLSEGLDIKANKENNTQDFDKNLIDKLYFDKALDKIWERYVRYSNKHIEDTKPWEIKKTGEKKFKEIMKGLVNDLHAVSELLAPFMPETSEKIKDALDGEKSEILFKRIT